MYETISVGELYGMGVIMRIAVSAERRTVYQNVNLGAIFENGRHPLPYGDLEFPDYYVNVKHG